MRLPQIKISNLALLLLGLPLAAAGQSPPTIGELFASESTPRGPVLLAGTGMAVASGSQLSAGKSVATLRLERGGELRICPNGSLTVSASQTNSRSEELTMGMDVGSVEVDYPINDMVGDTLVTPDFRLMLAGPGVFHFALGVNSQGDTCIRPRKGNSASLIVAEMIGNGVYQVKPDEAIVFAGGKLSGRTPLDGECGCPRPAPPVMVAGEKKPEEKNEEKPKPEPDIVAGTTPESPAVARGRVEVPLVYLNNPPVAPPSEVAKLDFNALPTMFLAQENSKPVVLKPGKGVVSEKKKGFFARIKGFFGAIFGK